MRTGAARGHRGYFHEALCYDSDEHLLAVTVPFLLDGAAACEPALVSFGPRNAALLRAALPADAGVTFLTGDDVYARPAAAIQSYRRLLAGHVAAGAGQIRIVGELPPAALGATWDWWARYESAINHAYDGFPLWSMCAYDTRVTPGPVLADVARTHPRVALPGDRHVRSEPYTEPEVFLLEDRAAVADPLQHADPAGDFIDPSPTQARRVIRGLPPGCLSARDLEGLVLAVSETVTNAHKYGREPVRMRFWTAADRVVVTVHDRGAGPKDPFAGLLPIGEGPGGRGLWITYQFCSHVTMERGPGGFTVRMVAGPPYTG